MTGLSLMLALLLPPQVVEQTPVDAVALALAKGSAAEAVADGKRMIEAADALDAMGARPEAGTIALSVQWRAAAKRLGVMAQATPYRGRALGPAYRSGVLKAGANLTTEQVFLAGRKATVALVPREPASLDLKIIGDGPVDLCSRVANPQATCDWMPVFTQRVRIRVENRSPRQASYFLVSN